MAETKTKHCHVVTGHAPENIKQDRGLQQNFLTTIEKDVQSTPDWPQLKTNLTNTLSLKTAKNISSDCWGPSPAKLFLRRRRRKSLLLKSKLLRAWIKGGKKRAGRKIFILRQMDSFNRREKLNCCWMRLDPLAGEGEDTMNAWHFLSIWPAQRRQGWGAAIHLSIPHVPGAVGVGWCTVSSTLGRSPRMKMLTSKGEKDFWFTSYPSSSPTSRHRNIVELFPSSKTRILSHEQEWMG